MVLLNESIFRNKIFIYQKLKSITDGYFKKYIIEEFIS